MKIGELALAAQTQVETIRYYEREGLLPQAPRSEGNYRIYGPEHVERLAFVRHCRSLDMTLDEIRVLLRFKDEPQAECGEVNALLDEHIGHVATRIRELRQLEKQLKALREQCAGVHDAGALRHPERTGAGVVSDGCQVGNVPGSHGARMSLFGLGVKPSCCRERLP
jgi:Cd(II)/Pb(II)-responsive transcriptional regulator